MHDRLTSQTLEYLTRQHHKPAFLPRSTEVKKLLAYTEVIEGNQLQWGTWTSAVALRIYMRFELGGRDPEVQVFETASIEDQVEWGELVENVDKIEVVCW